METVMPLETKPLDIAEFLDTAELQQEYLSQILADGDAAEIAYALGVLARARGMTDIAKAAGVSRENLYRALAQGGRPNLETTMRVITALGFRLTAQKVA